MRSLACLLTALAVVTAAHAADFTLVRDGKPLATIVISTTAGDKIKTAAADLQTYLQKMSGAKLPLVTDVGNPQGPLVLVGASKLTAGMAVPSGLTDSRREEGFTITCDGKQLLLAGNDAGPYHGTEYAVYEFLNRLGVRWFMPGDFGEIVPSKATVTCPTGTTVERPDFVMRDWWCHMPPALVPLEERWKIRNKLNPTRDFFFIPSDSSVRNVLDSKLVKDQPELFALNADGTRNPYYPNLTNPDAVKMVAEKVKAYFRQHPAANSYGFAPDDGMPRDFNPQTVKLNLGIPEILGRPGVASEASTSEEWFRLYNQVADAVHQDFPGKYLSTNGYANRDLPPQGVKTDEKLVLEFAAIWSCQLHGFDAPNCWQKVRQGQILEEWAKRCPNVWVYGYNYQMLVSGLTPLPEFTKLKRDFPLMHKWGVMGFLDETRNVWMESGIASRYLRARLEWDAEANVDAILDDFFRQWYGPAAGPLREYYYVLDRAIADGAVHGHEDRCLPELYTPALLDRLERLILQADQPSLREPYASRVRAEHHIFDHLRLYMSMTDAELAGDFGKAAIEGEGMLENRVELNRISPFFCQPGEKGYDTGVWYWTITDRVKWYREQADKLNGTSGKLVALCAPQALFRTDPHDEGLYAQWYRVGADVPDARAWKTLPLNRPFYAQGYQDAQGHPYVGQLWYRLDAQVPAAYAGKPMRLFVPNLTTEAWCWVNGQYVGYRPFQDAYIRPSSMEVDVTGAVKPGGNEIVMRVNTSLAEAQGAEGLWSRPFLYEPAK